MLKIDTSAFHDYDIRGIYPKEIDDNFYYHLGKALALFVKKGPIAVGHDTRLSSPSLSNSLIKGITDYGVDVIDIGLISTEMHYFASGKYGFEANVIVSASHNPPEYNGAKIVLKGVVPLSGSFGLDKLKILINKEVKKPGKKGKVTKKNIFNDWIKHALSFIGEKKLNKKLKVIVDAGNGMGGPSWMEMKKILPLKVIPLYCNPDGNFPHHIPDPLKPENTADLSKKVKEEQADLGISLDGDADRLFLIDEKGGRTNGTETLALLTDYFINVKKRKGVYMYNVIVGKVVKDIIEKGGCTPYRTRVGHSFIKADMKRLHGILAGEHSGHYYFGDNFNAESSLIAGLIILEALSYYKKPLSEIISKYRIYSSSGEINFKVKDREKAVNKLKEKFGKLAKKVDDLDGYTFWFSDYWFNIRLSKTESLIRLNMEANNDSLLKLKLEEVVSFIEKIGGKKK